MKSLVVPVVAILAMSSPAYSATNTDEAARADASAMFQLVTELVGPVTQAMDAVSKGSNAGIAGVLKTDVLDSLKNAIESWEGISAEIGWGDGEGNHYMTYSDCNSAAYQLSYLTADLVKFHEGRIASPEVRLELIDILLDELEDCGTSLDDGRE